MQPDRQAFRINGGVDASHALKEEAERNKLCKIKVHIQTYIYLATVADVEVDEKGGMILKKVSRTDIYSHINTPLVV